MAVSKHPDTLIDVLAAIDDPRIERRKLHRLLEILAIAVCATICGAEGFSDFADFGRARKEWLSSFLELPNGIPSHDTFRRVLGLLDPKLLEQTLIAWTASIAETINAAHLAIDGKTLRRSHNRRDGVPALHTISAWASQHRLVLAQTTATGQGGHNDEPAAIAELLRMLALKGTIVSIDAAGTHAKIATQIAEAGGEYLLALKGNQPTLLAEATTSIAAVREASSTPTARSYHQEVDKGHGRIEIRRCWVVEDAWPHADEWKHLRSFVLIERQREIAETLSIQHCYYLTSIPADAKLINQLARAHWGIENSVHWVLDVVMGEDANRTRVARAPKNLALLRRFAMNMLRRETSNHRGIKGRSKIAAWDNDYLRKVLTS